MGGGIREAEQGRLGLLDATEEHESDRRVEPLIVDTDERLETDEPVLDEPEHHRLNSATTSAVSADEDTFVDDVDADVGRHRRCMQDNREEAADPGRSDGVFAPE